MSPTTPIYSEKSTESLTYTSPLPVSFKKSRQQQFIENLFAKITTPSPNMGPLENSLLSERSIGINMAPLPSPMMGYPQRTNSEVAIHPHPLQPSSPKEEHSPKQSDLRELDKGYSADDDFADDDFPMGEEVEVYSGSKATLSSSPNTNEFFEVDLDNRTEEFLSFKNHTFSSPNTHDFFEVDLDNRTERFLSFKKHIFQFVDQDENMDPTTKNYLKSLIERDCSETVDDQNYLIEAVTQEIDVGKKDANGNTILHIAIESQFIEAIPYLQRDRHIVELGLVNEENNRGDTPLHLAVRMEFTEAIEMLAFYEANLNVKNSITGNTALLMALQSGSIDVVKTLLECGASRSEPNSLTGITPWAYLEIYHDTGSSEDEKLLNVFFGK